MGPGGFKQDPREDPYKARTAGLLRKVHGNTAPALTAPLWAFIPAGNPATGPPAHLGGRIPAWPILGPSRPILGHFGRVPSGGGQLENTAQKNLPR